MDIAVLGAGVSGLTAARLLSGRGHDVTVYEKCEKAGGLAVTRFTDGYLYDPHGGHIFNSKHQEVKDWVFGLMPKDKWQFSERNAKIFFNGRFVSYPFELSLCELDADTAIDCAYGFMEAQKGDEPDNFRDWLTWNFGEGIADSYMIPYNEKIWSYPLEDMETGWIRGKMPLPTKKDILRSLYLKDTTERNMPHSTFYYPLEGGIQTMINAISDGLRIKCCYPAENMEKRDGKWYINGEGGYDTVISTIPLTLLPKAMKLPDRVVKLIEMLRYNSLTTVIFSCPKTDISWLYIPSHDYRSHRVGYQSSLTPNACPDKSVSCGALEIIGERFDVDDTFAKRTDILPAELGFREALDSEFTEYAYVIHDKNYSRAVSGIKEYFAGDSSFRLLGRWGTWNYKNMDLCMLDAMKLVKEM